MPISAACTHFGIDVDLGAGQVEARHRADLRVGNDPDVDRGPFDLTEDLVRRAPTSCRQVGAGDLDVDRAAGGQALLEQARLLGDGERAGEIALADFAHQRDQSPACAGRAPADPGTPAGRGPRRRSRRSPG